MSSAYVLFRNMISGVLIHRHGALEAINVNCPEENLYKRCGFKTPNDFKMQTTWKYPERDTTLVLFAKAVGKANTENKYELPEPVASTLFYGKCLVMQKRADGSLVELTVQEWETVHDVLMGGVEEIESEEEASVESEVYPAEQYTKEGYLKDDFVVDSDDELEEEPYE